MIVGGITMFVVAYFLFYNQQSHGQLSHDVGKLLHFEGLDGRYVCDETKVPLTVTINGATGTEDLGMVKGVGMKVERHGQTVSMSGGQAYDSQNNPIDRQTRLLLENGEDVDLFTLGDDGQTLSLHLKNGGRLIFTKQP